MYDTFIADLRRNCPGFPAEPDLDLGLAIKQIRLRMGMTQEELARYAKIKPSALKTLENGYARFTKISNLEEIARALKVSLQETLLEAREWFPGNFFVVKLAEPQPNGERRRKRREEIWYRRKPLVYDGFKIDFVSPPLTVPSHFSFGIFEIEPGKGALGLKLASPNPVSGFVQRGTLRVSYDGGKEFDLFGNQGFSFRGDKPHDFINLDPHNPLRFCVAFSLTPSPRVKEEARAKPETGRLSIGRALRQIRRLYSDARDRLLTFAELSTLTGLDEKSLQYLEKTTRPDQVVYWDKIEKITQALKMPLARFLDLAEGRDEGFFVTATAHDRALIDYRHYLGVRIKSALLPGTGNAFHLSETYIEPKGGIRRVSWRRTDEAMIAVYLEDGELVIEVGKNRKAVIAAGESVYFDGRLGYIFTNPGAKPAKLLVATCPALIF